MAMAWELVHVYHSSLGRPVRSLLPNQDQIQLDKPHHPPTIGPQRSGAGQQRIPNLLSRKRHRDLVVLLSPNHSGSKEGVLRKTRPLALQ